MRSETRWFLVLALIGQYVDEPLFYSSLLLAFFYAMILLISEHAKNRHTLGGGR